MRIKNYKTTISRRTRKSKNICTRCTWFYMDVQSDLTELATVNSWSWGPCLRSLQLTWKNVIWRIFTYQFVTQQTQQQTWTNHTISIILPARRLIIKNQLVGSLDYPLAFYVSYSTNKVETPMIVTSSSPPSSEVNNPHWDCYQTWSPWRYITILILSDT